MKVGLFGGSFDPPHHGHLHVCQTALERLNLDEVWLIPTSQNPLKDKANLSYQERFKLCEILTQNNDKIFVKNFEKFSAKTYDLITEIIDKNSDKKFYFIMGKDNFKNFSSWYNHDKLISKIPFIIIDRNFSIDEKTQKSIEYYKKFDHNDSELPKFNFIETEMVDISSTEIRNSK